MGTGKRLNIYRVLISSCPTCDPRNLRVGQRGVRTRRHYASLRLRPCDGVDKRSAAKAAP